MELTLSKNDLNRAINITQSVVERKTTMPILANVLISATENHLRVSATDFEITAVVAVKAKVKSTGSTRVSV
ncbi:MAG: DNA polymerase III subunit beta, partial [Bdellovibrionales bacterium]|nr:DNA polymerase III subunit beta [Bdellovibrionales bacterium]